MDVARTRYTNSKRKLVVALDIGTTFSGAAYALMDPGEIPRIRSVTRYLNNPRPGSAKIPSVLYYDHDGNFRGVDNGIDSQDSDEFVKLKWWKLMLSPTELPDAMKDQMSTQLPKGKSIVAVFADFMRYLFDSTKEFFKASELNGELRWKSISKSIELVLTHPNGWGGPQQAKLRTAAIEAGIVPDTPAGRNSVRFVSEGEASFSFCATQTLAGKNLDSGDQVLIIDAGGGTIDISTYKVLNNNPLQVEELFEPSCLVQGGELVTVRATSIIKAKLKHSRSNTPRHLASFSRKFDRGVKRIFSTANCYADQYVRFGSPRDYDPECGIRAGILTLTGADVSEFFEPSIQSTVDSIEENFSGFLPPNSFAFLVGGFAASPWLSKQLQTQLWGLGFQVLKPDEHTNKAVAFGAVSYCADRFVKGRISKFTYGVPCNTAYRPDNHEHIIRQHKTFINSMGQKRVRGHFDTMLARGTRVMEDREIRQSFYLTTTTDDTPARQVSPEIVRYTGARYSPRWVDEEPDKFKALCNVNANISKAPYTTNPVTKGKRREYDIILLVGLTELKAQVCWFDPRTKKEKRSDAVVVYDDSS